MINGPLRLQDVQDHPVSISVNSQNRAQAIPLLERKEKEYQGRAIAMGEEFMRAGKVSFGALKLYIVQEMLYLDERLLAISGVTSTDLLKELRERCDNSECIDADRFYTAFAVIGNYVHYGGEGNVSCKS